EELIVQLPGDMLASVPCRIVESHHHDARCSEAAPLTELQHQHADDAKQITADSADSIYRRKQSGEGNGDECDEEWTHGDEDGISPDKIQVLQILLLFSSVEVLRRVRSLSTGLCTQATSEDLQFD
ncbi:hypothetical protein THAOC_11444, partial [Thalassiosira oceanica]